MQKNVNRALRSLPYPATVPGPGGVSCPLFWGGQLRLSTGSRNKNYD